MTGTANHWKESLAKNSQAHFLFLTCQSKLTKVTLAPIIKVFEKKAEESCSNSFDCVKGFENIALHFNHMIIVNRPKYP